MQKVKLAAFMILMCAFVSRPARADDAELFNAYRDVFNDYNNAITNQLPEYMLPDTVCYIADTTSADKIGFVFMDLNEDGITELLFGPYLPQERKRSVYYVADKEGEVISKRSPDDDANYIYNIFTLVNGNPVQIKFSWLRGKLYLAPEGRIYVSSLAEGVFRHELFEVKPGASEMRLYKCLASDFDAESLTAYDENGNEQPLSLDRNGTDFKTFCEEAAFRPIEFRPFKEWSEER